jgi:hypothetical protein
MLPVSGAPREFANSGLVEPNRLLGPQRSEPYRLAEIEYGKRIALRATAGFRRPLFGSTTRKLSGGCAMRRPRRASQGAAYRVRAITQITLSVASVVP